MDANAFSSLQFVRNLLLELPGVSERLFLEWPAFYVNGKIFCRLREDGLTYVVYTEERDRWMADDPETFFITPHFLNYKYMLVRLATIEPAQLKELLLTAWRKRAPKRMVAQYENNKG